MELYEAIKLTIEMEDESFIKDDRFINYLSDMQAFGEHVSNRNIFRQLCVAKYMDDIYTLWDSKADIDEPQILNRLRQMSISASQKFGFRQENVLFCLENVAYALRLISSISTTISDVLPDVEDKGIVGYWDFTYFRNKTMQLTIGHDGFARASSGTKYSWRISGNKVDIYIPDLVSYKGTLDGDTMSGFAVSTQNPAGWEWSAKKRGDGLIEANLVSGEWIIVNDVQELEDNVVRFLPDNILDSDLYGKGMWFLNNDSLEIVTANEFIKYTGKFVKGEISGVGRNRISNEWKFKLIKK
jgi:hypothetical protein